MTVETLTVNGADDKGHTRDPALIEPGDVTVMSLVPTSAPAWADETDQPRLHEMWGSELRLMLTVERTRKVGPLRRRPEQWVLSKVLPQPASGDRPEDGRSAT